VRVGGVAVEGTALRKINCDFIAIAFVEVDREGERNAGVTSVRTQVRIAEVRCERITGPQQQLEVCGGAKSAAGACVL
jgi:hypothetical protein